MAMIDPFDPRVNGVRLPNDFATPTVTQTVNGFSTVTVGVNDVALLYLPSPIISAYQALSGTIGGDLISYTQQNNAYQAVDQATLTSKFSSWRMVAGGLRIKSLVPATNQPVIVSIGTAPVVGCGPGPTFLNTITSQTTIGAINAIVDIVGAAPSTGRWGSQLTGFSNYNRFNTQDITTRSLTVPFRVTDARAFDFKTAKTGSGIGYAPTVTVYDQVTVNSATGVVNGSVGDNEEAFDFKGFSAIALEVKGNAGAILALEVEYIYHLEGIPAGNSLNQNAMNSANHADTAAGHLLDIAWANRQPLYKIARAMTGSLFDSVDPSLVANMLGIRL